MCGTGGKQLELCNIRPAPGFHYIHAQAEIQTKNDKKPKHVLISFGPVYAPMEQRQVEQAWREAKQLDPLPDTLLFVSFQFDAEAGKDIQDSRTDKTGIKFLKVQMDPDLLVRDLKKKERGTQSFWLLGQPDIQVSNAPGNTKDESNMIVEVTGFDYYDPKTEKVEDGNTEQIAVWLLDTDYDDRSLFPRQVFFPYQGRKNKWQKLAKNLRGHIDEEKVAYFSGSKSIPFPIPKSGCIAVKTIDNRGLESLRILRNVRQLLNLKK